MASAGWSNIFLLLMAGDTPPKIGLPVIGEGQLELPWKTQIELMSFSWDLDFKLKGAKKKETGSLLAAAGGMAAGMAAGNLAGAVGGQAGLAVAAAAAAAAAAISDFKEIPMIRMGLLKMKKRFDIASSRIHACCDADIKVQSAMISVLHIKQGGNSIHEPGFTLLARDGHFEKVDVSMEKTDKGVEVIEDLELRFRHVVITYSKRLGEHDVPMPPFVYVSPDEPSPGPSLPF